MPTNFDQSLRWVGRTRSQSDVLTTRLASELAALLDEPTPETGAPVPALWHWSLFPDFTPQSSLGEDGHTERGDFLPPVSLPRRLWAGSRLSFQRPLVVGSEVSRTSKILDVATKQGRSGELVIVRLRHRIEDRNGPLLSEEQDIVYCELPRASAPVREPVAAPATSTWRQTIVPDPVLLFRYSAATFNGHRIHYDRRFTQISEGYPALLVHGPLMATMLVGLVCRSLPGASISTFGFKAMAPVFDDRPFDLCAQYAGADSDVRVWVQNADGHLCIDGQVTLAGGVTPLEE